MKRCNKCKIDKSLSDFSKDKTKKDGLQYICKSCHKQYRINNKGKQYNKFSKEKHKQWRLDNKEKIAKRVNNRKQTHPLFKLSSTTRSLICNSMRKKGYNKSSKTYEILGCDFETFKLHLEKQFTKGMNWENQGKWHLDHIYPVSLAKNEQHLIELNHYTNFQPLWAVDNLSKSNNLREKQLFLL